MRSPAPLAVARAARTYSMAQATMARAQHRAERAGATLRAAALGAPDGRVSAGLWRVRIDDRGELTVAAIPQAPVNQLSLPLGD
ncbi:MAG: hypothetical protein M0027_12600 [Candidatus Dormibacteraeota bacterium]|nr:hypothetical protein [Candidatus Dormibacteraeota bacterium]